MVHSSTEIGRSTIDAEPRHGVIVLKNWGPTSIENEYARRVADLDEMARRGAKRRREQEQQLVGQREPIDAKQAAFARASTTRLGVLRTDPGGFVVAASVIVVAGYLLVKPVFDIQTSGAEIMLRLSAVLALAVLAVVAGRALASFAGARAYRNVRAWVEALPFPVDGFDRMLGGEPDDILEIRVEVVTSTNPERLADAAAALGNKVTSRVDNSAVVIAWKVWSHKDAAGPRAPATNYAALCAFQHTVEMLLRPLHAREPIAGVEVHCTGA